MAEINLYYSNFKTVFEEKLINILKCYKNSIWIKFKTSNKVKPIESLIKINAYYYNKLIRSGMKPAVLASVIYWYRWVSTWINLINKEITATKYCLFMLSK